MSQRPIRVQYYAILREERGCREETVDTDAATARDLYEQLKQEHAFSLDIAQLKVVINEEFSDWDTQLNADDEVVFIPPVAGG